MYSQERFLSLSPSGSLHSSLSPNTKVFHDGIQMDDYVYRRELPQGSSTEESIGNVNESSSDMREFSSCFTPCVPPIASPPFSSFFSAGSEERLFENEATYMECNGVQEDEGRKDCEHKKRSRNWTRRETLKLIKERSEIDALFMKAGRKTKLWDSIAESLQQESFLRDGQQCKDKWEKLSSGYKEVGHGVRDKADFPYYDELHILFFERLRRGGERAGLELFKDKQEVRSLNDVEVELGAEFASALSGCVDIKPKKSLDNQREELKHSDLFAVQELMETLLAKQQKFFVDLLNVMERREQAKEKIRQEREDRWKAEERAQRRVLNNTMVLLAQKLLDGHSTPDVSAFWTAGDYALDALGRPRKRLKFCKQ